jgi:hypothetical protein
VFSEWEKEQGDQAPKVDGVPLTRYWLIPSKRRPKLYMPHPTMDAQEIRTLTQMVWDDFYSVGAIWQRSNCVKSLKFRLAFLLISKLYRQMYANTGISADVRQHRDFGRQCPAPHLKSVGTLDREALQETVSGQTNAGIANP